MDGSRNIALLGHGFHGWGGGIDYLSWLASALDSSPDFNKITLVVPQDTIHTVKYELKNSFYRVRSQHPPLVSETRTLIKNITDEVKGARKHNLIEEVKKSNHLITVARCKENTTQLIKTLRRSGTEVCLPSIASLGSDFPIPWIGYMPDMQHKHLPEMFDAATTGSRDRHYEIMFNECSTMIVNSRQVVDDIRRYYNKSQTKLFVLPFSPRSPLAPIASDTISRAKAFYKIPDRYFIISNQLWKHKNHILAIEALASMMETDNQARNVHLVMTGETSDHRYPDHLKNIMKRISELRLEDKAHILGRIPKEDQLALMNGSIGVLQPTLFEGGPGGGAVYDAMTWGVPAIVSDIAVNKEIEDPLVIFHKSGSIEDLASKMSELLAHPPERPSIEELQKHGEMRAHQLRKQLLAAIDYAKGS